MKPIFQKNLQFGDIWRRNRQKIAQIEVFRHFLDFALLVFLDFPHNDRCAWCLVVFLQFAGPVNVFLFLSRIRLVFVSTSFHKWRINEIFTGNTHFSKHLRRMYFQRLTWSFVILISPKGLVLTRVLSGFDLKVSTFKSEYIQGFN